ncbi:MAG: rhomboid family intramembrane serine protease [Acidobacteriota bacterium]
MIPLRDENPTRTFPFVTIAIIVSNVIVFGYEVLLPPELLENLLRRYAIIPYNLVHFSISTQPSGFPNIFTLISSTFLHGGIWHIVGNMLFLWIFGNNVEDALGHFKFIFFYFISASVAGLSQSFTSPDSYIPVIGASGAVAGVLGAYFVLYPHARVVTLFWLFIFIRIVKVPALVFLALWFFLQVMYAGMGGGIAWFAHIGGFIAGILMILPAWLRRKHFLHL